MAKTFFSPKSVNDWLDPALFVRIPHKRFRIDRIQIRHTGIVLYVRLNVLVYPNSSFLCFYLLISTTENYEYISFGHVCSYSYFTIVSMYIICVYMPLFSMSILCIQMLLLRIHHLYSVAKYLSYSLQYCCNPT